MLQCYLDDSDAQTSKVLTIAGYVAHEEGWQRFESEAERLCKKYEVELIRGRQIDGRKDCFKGWPLPKCERFLDELGFAMVGNVLFGISRSIGKENFKARRRQLMALDNTHKRHFSGMSAFGFCFASMVLDFRENPAYGIGDEVKQAGIAFKLEAGSANNANIASYLVSERDHGNLIDAVTVEEVDKRSCRAVQMADLYAFYSRRRGNQYARLKGLEFVPDIHKLHVGRKVPHHTGYIEEPFIKGTNTRTGETFSLTGLLTNLAK